jgi:hypothetical protein
LFFGGGGFENELEVEGKSGVVLTLVNDIEDMVFVLKETFNEEGGGDKRLSVEDGGVHGKKRVGLRRS